MILFIIHCKNTSNNRHNKILQKQLHQILQSATALGLRLQFTERAFTQWKDNLIIQNTFIA